MPYSPTAEHRRNIQGVLEPLTAAIHHVFGNREQDLARPIGAFYTVNINRDRWEHVGGIWFRFRDEQAMVDRRVNADSVRAFAAYHEALQLPPPLASYSQPNRGMTSQI